MPKRVTRLKLFALMFGLAWLAPSVAVGADTVRLESEEDRRVREISKQLRCAVCQNESVADSNAGLARDMRELVREQVRQGKRDDEILAFFVERYGDYILMEPRRTGVNWLLWLLPFAALIAGLIGITVWIRSSQVSAQSVQDPGPSVSDDALLAALRGHSGKDET